MIIYVLIAAFVGGLAVGGGGMKWWDNAAEARLAADLAEAQAKVDELAHDVQVTAAKGQEDERIAYIAGEANAKTITKIVYAKGQAYAASNLSNPACFIPADGLQLIVSARAGTEPPPASSGGNGAVPGAGPGNAGSTGRGSVAGGNVPAVDAGRSSGGGVPQTAGSAGANGQVSGTGARPVPTNPLKPK